LSINTCVCHHKKGGDCWNKISLNNASLSFDDNKVLKDQLDMLIFVQVCKTIYKNYTKSYSSIGFERKNV